MRGNFPVKISGAGLKWFAILTMLIDHIGCCLIEVYTMNAFGNATFTGFKSLPVDTRLLIFHVDQVLRCVGRLAFPIFCFLLVEGFLHTKDVKKYASRLLIFGLISEIPGDLAIKGSFFTLDYQNVYWTLLLGLICICLSDYFENTGNKFLGVISAVGCMLAAEYFHCDYGMSGVLLIWFFFIGRRSRYLQAGLGAVWCILYGGIEVWGVFSMILLLLYSGERGRQPRYLFYTFYPVHLMILALVGRYLLPMLLV